MSGDNEVQRFEADFKKVAGNLTLTATTIAWVPKVANAMDRQQQAMSRAVSQYPICPSPSRRLIIPKLDMLASKSGSERISLKILFKDDLPANGLMFTFTNTTSREEDRRIVQDVLIPFVSGNRAGPPALVHVPSPVQAGPSTPGTPTRAAVTAAKGKRKADDGMPEGNPTKTARPANNKLRLRVLNKHPNLKILHRELVLGKQITEEEFWEGREVC